MTGTALLLEFEGVLVQTGLARREALLAALRDEGLGTPPDEVLASACRMPMPAGVRLAVRAADPHADDTTFALAELRAERAFADLARRGLPLTPGAAEFLHRAAATTRVALVTRCTRREMELLLALADLTDLATVMVTADDRLPPRPDPTAHRHALARLARLGPLGGAVAIEDTLAGVAAARAAGIAAVLVGDGEGGDRGRADAYLPSLAGMDPVELARLARRREAVSQ